MLKRSQTGLTKAQKRKFIEYLDILELAIPNLITLHQISDRVKNRQAQKQRSYRRAICLMRWHIEPTDKVPNLKNTMQYIRNESLQLHSESRKHKVREIPKRKQLASIKKIPAFNVSRLPLL